MSPSLQPSNISRRSFLAGAEYRLPRSQRQSDHGVLVGPFVLADRRFLEREG